MNPRFWSLLLATFHLSLSLRFFTELTLSEDGNLRVRMAGRGQPYSMGEQQGVRIGFGSISSTRVPSGSYRFSCHFPSRPILGFCGFNPSRTTSSYAFSTLGTPMPGDASRPGCAEWDDERSAYIPASLTHSGRAYPPNLFRYPSFPHTTSR